MFDFIIGLYILVVIVVIALFIYQIKNKTINPFSAIAFLLDLGFFGSTPLGSLSVVSEGFYNLLGTTLFIGAVIFSILGWWRSKNDPSKKRAAKIVFFVILGNIIFLYAVILLSALFLFRPY